MICLICTSNYSIRLVVCYTGPQYCDLYKKQLHGIGGGGHGAQGSQQSQSLVGQLGLCVSGVQLYSVHLCGIGVHSLVSATARSCSSVPGNYHTFACQGSFNDMCFMVRNCIVCSGTQRVQLYATAVLVGPCKLYSTNVRYIAATSYISAHWQSTLHHGSNECDQFSRDIHS